MLDLDPKYVAVVQKILTDHIPNKIVWVYGSRIKGSAHAGSDLDLVVVSPNESITEAQLTALRTAFSESNLPILIDIVNWGTIPETFQHEIEKAHEVFYPITKNA